MRIKSHLEKSIWNGWRRLSFVSQTIKTKGQEDSSSDSNFRVRPSQVVYMRFRRYLVVLEKYWDYLSTKLRIHRIEARRCGYVDRYMCSTRSIALIIVRYRSSCRGIFQKVLFAWLRTNASPGQKLRPVFKPFGFTHKGIGLDLTSSADMEYACAFP